MEIFISNNAALQVNNDALQPNSDAMQPDILFSRLAKQYSLRALPFHTQL